MRALSTLVFSDNVDLQRSASLTFAEITERGEKFDADPVEDIRPRYKKSLFTTVSDWDLGCSNLRISICLRVHWTLLTLTYRCPRSRPRYPRTYSLPSPKPRHRGSACSERSFGEFGRQQYVTTCRLAFENGMACACY